MRIVDHDDSSGGGGDDDVGGPGARWLLVAHQDSDCFAVYGLSRETGAIGELVASHDVGSAGNVCVMALER
jgi:6-phosphogluconolactonase (cycloisomerase 2 family)